MYNFFEEIKSNRIVVNARTLGAVERERERERERESLYLTCNFLSLYSCLFQTSDLAISAKPACQNVKNCVAVCNANILKFNRFFKGRTISFFKMLKNDIGLSFVALFNNMRAGPFINGLNNQVYEGSV